MHPLNKLKQDGAELVTREELEAALAPIRAALEISEFDQEIDEAEELVPGEDELPEEETFEPLPEAVEGESEEHVSTPRRSRKRKPENEDPLDLVPEEEG